MGTLPERYPANRVSPCWPPLSPCCSPSSSSFWPLTRNTFASHRSGCNKQTVPKIIRFQRLARNLDQLRREGELVFSSDTPEGRRQSLYLVMLIASHPSILEHPQAAAARDTETFLTEMGRLAALGPGQPQGAACGMATAFPTTEPAGR